MQRGGEKLCNERMLLQLKMGKSVQEEEWETTPPSSHKIMSLLLWGGTHTSGESTTAGSAGGSRHGGREWSWHKEEETCKRPTAKAYLRIRPAQASGCWRTPPSLLIGPAKSAMSKLPDHHSCILFYNNESHSHKGISQFNWLVDIFAPLIKVTVCTLTGIRNTYCYVALNLWKHNVYISLSLCEDWGGHQHLNWLFILTNTNGLWRFNVIVAIRVDGKEEETLKRDSLTL